MVAAAVRRMFFMGVVLAGASFASFVFFWFVDLPLKGQSALHGYRLWLGGLAERPELSRPVRAVPALGRRSGSRSSTRWS